MTKMQFFEALLVISILGKSHAVSVHRIRREIDPCWEQYYDPNPPLEEQYYWDDQQFYPSYMGPRPPLLGQMPPCGQALVPPPRFPWPDCCWSSCLPDCLVWPPTGPVVPTLPPVTLPPVTLPPVILPPNRRCPITIPGWIELDGTEYYLGAPSRSRSWYSSEAKAVELGGFLAEIESPEETEALQAIENCYPSGTKLWIGGNNLADEFQWVWSRGSVIEGYSNWGSIDGLDLTGKRCMELRFEGNSNKWFPADCHGDQGLAAFVVEKESTSPSSTPRPQTSSPTPTRTTTTTTTSTPSPATTTTSTTKPPYITTTEVVTARPPFVTSSSPAEETTPNAGTPPPPVR